MPVLYPMAKKVYRAQQDAPQNGETLVVYEAYRPYAVRMTIVRALKKLAGENKTVPERAAGGPVRPLNF